jgi:replication-associated recombination protein RarA
MMPRTMNGLRPLDVLSCLQKAIRRSEERLAMQCAVELMSSRSNYFTMTMNRLRIILHEDLAVVDNPSVIAGVEATLQQIEMIRSDPQKASKCRMLMGTIIRMMCRCPKSREGDHFHVAVGRPVIHGYPPELPDWTFDKHTSAGRRQGRGLDHFRESSCMLVPAPAKKDEYEDEAFAIWGAEERGEEPPYGPIVDKQPPGTTPNDLFDE